MNGAAEPLDPTWRDVRALRWGAFLKQREEQVFLALTLLIGALVGLTVVAFVVLTEHFGARISPMNASGWQRLVVPVMGSLTMGYLLYKYFPDARGSGRTPSQ